MDFWSFFTDWNSNRGVLQKVTFKGGWDDKSWLSLMNRVTDNLWWGVWIVRGENYEVHDWREKKHMMYHRVLTGNIYEYDSWWRWHTKNTTATAKHHKSTWLQKCPVSSITNCAEQENFGKRGNMKTLRDKKLNQSQRALASLADQGCRADKLFKAMNFTRFQVSE